MQYECLLNYFSLNIFFRLLILIIKKTTTHTYEVMKY